MPIRRTLSLLGGVLALLLLAAVDVVAYRSARHQAAYERWVLHTQEVIEQLEGIRSGIATAESALRGFVLTTDARYLVEFEPGLLHAQRSLQGVLRLTKDNRVQQARLETLKLFVERRVALLLTHRESAKQGERWAPPEQARELTEQIRANVERMLHEERRLLRQRRELADSKVDTTSHTVLGGVSLSLLLGAGALWLTLRETRRRERAERELVREHSILDSIFEGTTDTIYVKNSRGRYLLINTAGAAVFGKSVAEVVGSDDRDLLPPGAAGKLVERDLAVMQSGESKTYEEEIEVGGEPRVFLSTKAPYRGPDRQIISLIGISRDVTQRKRAEEARLAEMSLLLEMGELLQACRTIDEATVVVDKLAARFFPRQSGSVSIFFSSRNLLDTTVVWGDASLANKGATFPPDECWALRRGQPHLVDEKTGSVGCGHLPPRPTAGAVLCVPMLAHGEVLGVLSLHSQSQFSNEERHLVNVVADQISLAIANLRLRETLRNQSIRDPLTGLFNRRYAEETLDRELYRAEREKTALSVVVIDVDHFKRFNDSFGHDAGDQVLRSIAEVLSARTRGGDVVARMGGEELLLILPGATANEAHRKADALREEVAALRVAHMGRALGEVTFSGGVATSDGTQPLGSKALLIAADEALYRAKREGRNRLIIAS
jgi:diguanylate cyclase (GGDEF)-like protein/PAS domain S-box-containing protein